MRRGCLIFVLMVVALVAATSLPHGNAISRKPPHILPSTPLYRRTPQKLRLYPSKPENSWKPAYHHPPPTRSRFTKRDSSRRDSSRKFLKTSNPSLRRNSRSQSSHLRYLREKWDESDTMEIDFTDSELQKLAETTLSGRHTKLEEAIVDAINAKKPDLIRALINCPICLQSMNAEKLATLKCDHVEHRECHGETPNAPCSVCRDVGPHEDVDRGTNFKKFLELFERKGWMPPAPEMTAIAEDRVKLAEKLKEMRPETWMMERVRILLLIWREDMLKAASAMEKYVIRFPQVAADDFVKWNEELWKVSSSRYAKSLFELEEKPLVVRTPSFHAWMRNLAYSVYDRYERRRTTELDPFNQTSLIEFTKYTSDLEGAEKVVLRTLKSFRSRYWVHEDSAVIPEAHLFADFDDFIDCYNEAYGELPWFSGEPDPVEHFRKNVMDLKSNVGGALLNLEYDYKDLI